VHIGHFGLRGDIGAYKRGQAVGWGELNEMAPIRKGLASCAQTPCVLVAHTSQEMKLVFVCIFRISAVGHKFIITQIHLYSFHEPSAGSKNCSSASTFALEAGTVASVMSSYGPGK